MKLSAWIAALALLAACVHTPPAPATTAEIGIALPAGASDWLVGHYTERVLLFHNTYAEPMNGGVAFVGDSITEGGDWAALFPGIATRNYGIGGDTTVGLDNRLAQIVAARPAKVFLLIGTNDLNNDHRAPAEIVANTERLLERFARELPQTQLYVQSVLPREPPNAEGVRQINEGLRRITSARGVAYVDIYTPFMVGDGVLDPTTTYDQLHLNGAGYERWRDTIAPLVVPPASSRQR
jgi:lysophospholipase L1-like esterase